MLTGEAVAKETMNMAEQHMITLLRETFDAVSGGSGNGALRLFPKSAEHMAAMTGLRGDEQVLDIACGAGILRPQGGVV